MNLLHYKTEWHYKDCGRFPLLLKIDEESSVEDIEAEIDYWMDEIYLYEIEGFYKQEIMKAIKWMAMIIDEKT